MIYTTRRPINRSVATAPHFGNLINEWMNTPVKEISQEYKERYTRPAINVIQHEEHYHLSLAVPGMNKEDISIEIDNNKLWISAKTENKVDADYKLREFHYGKFKRSFILPENVDAENITAKMENGVLEIKLNIIPEPKPYKIDIN